MSDSGRVALHTVAEGRVLEYWEGGDPHGRPVVLHDGTPATYALAVPQHETALGRGVRLIVLNRPGYGRSTPRRSSLAATGRDTAALARALGCPEYSVVGISGGGPYAVATAVFDPESVRAVSLVGGVGPWTTLSEPTEGDAAERALLARIGTDSPDALRAEFLALAEADFGPLRDMDDEARVDALLGGFSSPLASDPTIRSAFAANLRVVLDGPHGVQGYVDDNLAWGGPWDVDPAKVVAPTSLWYGADDVRCSVRHGEWYAERIPDARLTVLPGDHLDVCAGSWPLVYDALG